MIPTINLLAYEDSNEACIGSGGIMIHELVAHIKSIGIAYKELEELQRETHHEAESNLRNRETECDATRQNCQACTHCYRRLEARLQRLKESHRR